MKKITPERYREILQGLELRNIFLSEVKAKVKPELLSEGIKIDIKENSEFSFENDRLIVTTKYTLTTKRKSKKSILNIEATYILEFNSKYEINDDFFEIYKEISLPLNTWPFFREFVNSITARMNIPPLVLPLLKR